MFPFVNKTAHLNHRLSHLLLLSIVVSGLVFASQAQTSQQTVLSQRIVPSLAIPQGADPREFRLAPDSFLARKFQIGSAVGSAAQKSISFTSPKPAQIMYDGQITPQIHLANGLDPATFKLRVNGKDASSRMTSMFSCDSTLCDKSGTLEATDGIIPGWNTLTASAHNAHGNVGWAKLRFYVPEPNAPLNSRPTKFAASLAKPQIVGDPTTTLTQYSVHLVINANGDITIGDSPNASQFANTCATNELRIAAYNQNTLQRTASDCIVTNDNGASLASHFQGLSGDKTDFIVIAMNSAGAMGGGLDFSPMGGTTFGSGASTVVAYGYNAIGYMNSTTSTYELISTFGPPPVPGIDGVLQNVCCVASTPNNPWYIFRPADAPGFSVYFDESAQAHITVDYDKTMPLGVPVNAAGAPTNPSLNYVAPSLGAFNPVQFDSTSAGQPTLIAKGVAREDLSPRFYQSLTFDLNETDDANQMATLAAALVNEIAQHSDDLFFITYSGSAMADAPLESTTSEGMADLIKFLGVPPADLDNAMKQGVPFSMVATADGVQPSGQWWGTAVNTQQAQSGNLNGVLTRNHQMLLTPTNVMPVISINSTTTADLSRSDSYAIGSARPVAWPLSDTSGGQLAYIWLSNLLVNYDFYGMPPSPANAGTCPVPQCSDIRFYYTGSELTTVLGGLDPLDPRIVQEYSEEPALTSEFTIADLSALQNQLELEKAFLNNASSYQHVIDLLFAEGDSTIALVLSNAATQTSVGLYDSLPNTLSTPAVPASKLATASAIFNDVAAVASFAGPIGAAIGDAATVGSDLAEVAKTFSSAAGIASGETWSISGLLGTLAGSGSAGITINDTQVQTFADLLATTSNTATTAALTYAENMEEANGTFYDAVYSDWYKLETTGLMTANPAAAGWYIQDAGTTASQQLPTLLAGARLSFYQQLLPQLFVKETFPGMVNSYNGDSLQTMETVCWGSGASTLPNKNALGYTQPTLFTNQYWGYATPTEFVYSVGLTGETGDNGGNGKDVAAITVNVPAVTQSPSTTFTPIAWSSDIGNELFAAPNLSVTDGTGSLNLPGNLLYLTSALLPDNYLGCPLLGTGAFQTRSVSPGTVAAAPPVSGSSTRVGLAGTFDGEGNLDLTATANLRNVVFSSGAFEIQNNGVQISGGVGSMNATGKQATASIVLPVSTLPSGSFPLNAVYLGDSTNGSGDSPSVTFTLPTLISISTNTPTLSITDGSQGQVQLDLASIGGFTGSVNLSCAVAASSGTTVTVLPSCTLSQTTFQMASGQKPTATMLTVNTAPSSATSSVSNLLGGSGIVLLSFCVIVPMRRRKLTASFMVVVMNLLLLSTGGAIGCGGGGSGQASSPPPAPTAAVGSYTVTVTANSGSLSATSSIVVTVTGS